MTHCLGNPASERFHVGVSDSELTQLNETTQNGLSKCKVLEPPLAVDTDIDVACLNKIYGRYVYISLVRDSDGDGYFQLYEVEVYMGELIDVRT